MDKDIIKFPRKNASAEKMEADKKALLDAVRMIYEKGREKAVKVYGQNYFVIAETPFSMKELGIRGQGLYTKIKFNDGFVTVGVEVKNMGINLEVNSIQTVFIRRRKGDLEEEIYRVPDITQEQSAILDRGK